MQSTACNITCITAHSDCSAAVIGLSSGQLLHLTVGKSVAATAHSDSNAGNADELSTGIRGVSSDHATESGSSPSAALNIVPISRQHNAAVSAAQMSPDGRLLASLSAPDGVTVIMEYSASATSFHVVSEAVLPGASCLAWLPAVGRDTCKRLLLGCNDGQLVVRNTFGRGLLPVSLVRGQGIDTVNWRSDLCHQCHAAQQTQYEMCCLWKADLNPESHMRPPACTRYLLVHSWNVAVHPLL